MKEKNEIKNILVKSFDLDELENINFGKLEGERDNMLESSFFPTKTVVKYLKNPYNYVLSPKGAGKSALYRALSERFIRKIYR